MHLPRRVLACVLLLALGACGSGDLTLPNEGQPADVVVFSGNGQTGTILESPPQPLVVRVTDRFGNPVAGVPIEWSATGGGDVRPASAVTDTDGRAATQRILGSEPGGMRPIAACKEPVHPDPPKPGGFPCLPLRIQGVRPEPAKVYRVLTVVNELPQAERRSSDISPRLA